MTRESPEEVLQYIFAHIHEKPNQPDAKLRHSAEYKEQLQTWSGSRIARELSPQGITINTISPGHVLETEFFGSGGLSEAGVRNRVAQIPAGRPGQPDDVANAVFFLASDQASYITGEVCTSTAAGFSVTNGFGWRSRPRAN